VEESCQSDNIADKDLYAPMAHKDSRPDVLTL